jgi:hypothetical protein
VRFSSLSPGRQGPKSVQSLAAFVKGCESLHIEYMPEMSFCLPGDSDNDRANL